MVALRDISQVSTALSHCNVLIMCSRFQVVPQGHGGWMGLTDYATAEELDTAVRRLNGSQFIDRSGRGRAIVRVTKEHQKHRGR